MLTCLEGQTLEPVKRTMTTDYTHVPQSGAARSRSSQVLPLRASGQLFSPVAPPIPDPAAPGVAPPGSSVFPEEEMKQ